MNSTARCAVGRARTEDEPGGASQLGEMVCALIAHQLKGGGDDEPVATEVGVRVPDVDVNPERAQRLVEEHHLAPVARSLAVRLLVINPEALVVMKDGDRRLDYSVGAAAYLEGGHLRPAPVERL